MAARHASAWNALYKCAPYIVTMALLWTPMAVKRANAMSVLQLPALANIVHMVMQWTPMAARHANALNALNRFV